MSDAWPIDHAVLDAVLEHRTPWLDTVTLAVGHAGTSVVGLGLAALAGIALAVARRSWRPVAAVVLAVFVAGGSVGYLKEVFARPRADAAVQLLEGVGYAFPSTHAAFTSAAAAALVASVAWSSRSAARWAALLLGALVVVVGAMMVYLASHWFTDVLVGWAMGVPIGVVVGLLLRERTRRPARPGRSPRQAAPVH